jgi:hypothetical protein
MSWGMSGRYCVGLEVMLLTAMSVSMTVTAAGAAATSDPLERHSTVS